MFTYIVMSCVYLLLQHDLHSSCCVSIATSFAKYLEFLVNRTLKVQHFYFQWAWYLDLSHCRILENISLYDYASMVLGSTKPGRWVQRLLSSDLKVVEP